MKLCRLVSSHHTTEVQSMTLTCTAVCEHAQHTRDPTPTIFTKSQFRLERNKILRHRKNPRECNGSAAPYSKKGIPRILLLIETTLDKACVFRWGVLRRSVNAKLRYSIVSFFIATLRIPYDKISYILLTWLEISFSSRYWFTSYFQ